MVNQNCQKTYILYKGHTGWRVKIRLLGGLIMTLSALTLAETTGVIDGHAATDDSNDGQATVNGSVTQKKQVALRSAAPSQQTPSTPQEKVPAQDDVPAPDTENDTSNSPAASDGTGQPQAVTDSDSQKTSPAATPTYPVLSPDKDVSVGADTSEVDLTADQIKQHFTATVENRGNSDQDDDPTDNQVTQQIGADGSISLTSNDAHPYYTSPGYSTSVTGHQVAHVSFEHEIDFSHNFSMSGALGVGSKSSKGADSIGFVFAPGNPATATKGGSGGMLGIQGLKNAFGFVFDEYHNDDYHDPGYGPYVGWRVTDANGDLQAAQSSDWKPASALGLSRTSTPTNDFTMTYDAGTQMLTVTLKGQSFSRKIDDISTGYSISVAASTGGSLNDYSAKIDKFSYTPKTIPLTVNLVDNAEQGALLNQTKVTAIANIGDTISVFSTQDAANRAVASGVVSDPSLVTVLPTDSGDNVYVIDGNQVIANNNGTAHTLGDKTLADATYYTYTVTDQDNQDLTVPVRLAFKAQVTPVDSVTKAPIAGLKPVTVVAVKGEPVLIQIPGYTPAKVVLDAPATGETTANDQLLIDQTTTSSATQTPTNRANAIGHYYTSSGKTVDGKPVTSVATVGTGQSIATGLAAGTTVSGTSETPTGTENYYWSDVGNAVATDSTDASQAQATGSVLVPTKATLDYYNQQAVTYQKNADTYKAQAQTLFDQFIVLKGLTQAQKDAAQTALDVLKKTYTDISTSNQAAQTAFNAAEQSTDDATIYNDGQTGYANLQKVQNLLGQFKVDLDKLDTTNTQAQDSLATLHSQTITYGQSVGDVEADLGDGFGDTYGKQTLTLDAKYVAFVNQKDSTGASVTPKDVGTYVINLTDAGRAYLRTLNPSNENIGLFVSGFLTITPAKTSATLEPTTVVYGDEPKVSGDLGQGQGNQALQVADFEIWNADNQVVTTPLQAGQSYTIHYSAAKQKALKADSNYDYTNFGSAALTVTPRPITVTVEETGKTYGDSDPKQLNLTSDSANGLVKRDTLTGLGVALTRESGETAGSYQITLDQQKSKLNTNYQITVTPGTFTIGKKPITVTANSLTKTFGAADPELTLTIQPGDLVGQDSAKDLGITLSRVKGEDVNSYTIGVDAGQTRTVSSANYAVTVQPGTLKITPAATIVTAAPVTMTYGDTPTFTATFSVPGSTSGLAQSDFEVVDDQGKVIEPSRLQANGAYTAQLTAVAQARLGENKNYAFTFDGGKVTVNCRAVKVTIDNVQKVYGQLDPKPFTYQTTVLVNDDSPADLGVVLTRDKGENAGKYTIGEAGTYTHGNYQVTVESGILTITPAPTTVAVAPATVTYGDTPNFTVASTVPGLTSALAQTDFEVVDDQGNVAKPSQLQAGDKYTVQLTADAQQRIRNNKNYHYTFGSGNLTVNKRQITVQADSPTMTYNTSTPELTFTITDGNLVDGDTPDALKVVLTRQPGTEAGEYYIMESTGGRGTVPSKNYAVTILPGTLTIAPAVASVTVTPSKVTPGKGLTVSATTSVAGPQLTTADFELVGDKGQVVMPSKLSAGQYTIQLTQAAKDKLKLAYPDYTFDIVPTKLTVDRAGNTTATQTDPAGDVVKVTKQWTDESTTVYVYDLPKQLVTITEAVKGKPTGTKTLALPVKGLTFSDGNGTFTTVTITDPNKPVINHYHVNPAGPAAVDPQPQVSDDTTRPAQVAVPQLIDTNMPQAMASSRGKFTGRASVVHLIKPSKAKRIDQTVTTHHNRTQVSQSGQRSWSRQTAKLGADGQSQLTRSGRLNATGNWQKQQQQQEQQRRQQMSDARQQADQARLPQTGEAQNFWALLGTLLLGWLLVLFRRRQNK